MTPPEWKKEQERKKDQKRKVKIKERDKKKKEEKALEPAFPKGRNYETEILKQQIAMLKATIIREEEKASELEFKSRIFSDGEVNSQKQDSILNMLNKKVDDVYKSCIGEVPAKISTLQMLTSIENRMEELLESLETLPRDKVEAVERSKEKEMRLRKRVLIGQRVCAEGGLGRVAAGVSHQCENQACNPRMGNLALGRKLLTESVCGHNSTELYCSYTENADRSCRPPKCGKCNAAHHQHSHLPAAMTDSSFRFPNTWWQSAEGVQRETIQLDLGGEFYFTHMIMVFKSPRPAAMLLERSQDFGKTWRPCKYYATNCYETFGLGDDTEQDGALCTTKYSGAFPCTRGEVIYRALSPLHSAVDPYSAESQDQLKVTNIRVQLLKRQQCPCLGKDPATKPQHLAHYAVYHFIVKGSCFCNGHAEHCVTVDGYRSVRERTHHMVCLVKKKQQEPPHPPYLSTCACHPVGSVPYQLSAFSLCDPSNGECVCKPGVGGPHCDKCMVGYWGFGEYGCRPCDCAGSCDPFTGDCISSSSDVDWYHKSDYLSQHNETEPVWDWVDEQGFSALRHSGKCECKEQVLGNPKIFCAMKYTYGMEYLVAGHMDRRMGRLIVNMKSFVKPWKPDLGRKVMQFLKTDCKW
ncbi:Netrin-4 [Acipenser ruthenus]|uniref:Netrin-4 n=1 Tax=Acipenser ruthenus TaxID=7906 RepID=A0A662YPF6_ACIRT|nr:Netrin-4 [Acipenser ruthenus]